MKLNEWIDVAELGRLIDDRLVTARKHPRFPLIILNYSPAAQSEKNWSETLSRCRGLIYEEGTLDIYAIPFSKFWSYNDPSHPETLQENLPKSEPHIYEKADGSLGIGFFYQNEFIIATRGSFESEQAKWANNWVEDNGWVPNMVIPVLDHRLTYLFEIIMPSDKKVINYDYSGLVVLGYTLTSNGLEFDPEYLVKIPWLHGYKVVKRYDYEDLEELSKKEIKNFEGWVVSWYNYNGSTLRVKIKLEEYKRLHRLYFQTTTDVIWELLKNQGDIEEYAKATGDQKLKDWVTAKAIEMAGARGNLDKETRLEYYKINGFLTAHFETTIEKQQRRKAFAMEATRYKQPSLLFLLYDAKNEEYQEMLWKLCKPKNTFYRREDADSG